MQIDFPDLSTKGRGHGGRGNRGGHGFSNRNNKKKRNKGYGMSSKHFKGACKDIEDNIFVVNKPNAADTYNKSVEAISNYVGREYSQE